MAKSMNFALNVSATLNGNLQSQLKAAQGAMNALKHSANGNINLKLNGLQAQLAQIQKYKDAMRAIPAAQKQLQQSIKQNSQAAAEKRLAAERLANLKIQLQSFQTAQVGLKKTSQEYRNLQNQIKATKSEIRQANEILKMADTALKASQGAVLNNGQNLSRQISQLQQLRGALSSAGVSLNQLGAAESHLRSQIDATNNALQRQQQMAARRANLSTATDNFSNAYSNMQNAVQTAEGIMSPFVDAARQAMDYEYELMAVKAKTQFNDIRAGNIEKANAAMAKLDATARRLGATTEYTSLEVAQAMDKFAMGGWKAEWIDSVMDPFMDLATATRTKGYNFARLGDVYSDLMTAAGLKPTDTITLGDKTQVNAGKYFNDALAYAVNNANQDIEDVYTSGKYYIPIAKQLGLSVAEMFALTMVTANSSIKGSNSGTAIRAGLMRLNAPTKAAAATLAEMGMTMSDAQREYNEAGAAMSALGVDATTFSGKLLQLAEAFSKMPKEQMTAEVNKVFGMRAAPAWMTIFENLEKVKQTVKLAQTMDSAEISGYSEEVAKSMRESTHVQWEMAKSAMAAAVNQVGTALLPSVIQISQTIAPILTDLAEWISKNQEVVVTLAGIAAAVSAVIVAAAGIQLISAAFGMVNSAALLAKEGIATAVAILRGASFAGIASAIKTIGSAFMVAARGALAFILTPVGAVCAAIALAAYLIYTNWDKLAPMFQRVADVLKSAFGSAVEFVSGLWDGLVEKFNKLREFLNFDFGGKNSSNNFGTMPTYQSASLGNIGAGDKGIGDRIQESRRQGTGNITTTLSNYPTATLDFSNAQAQVDNFANSLQNQNFNFENFGANLQSQTANIQSQTSNLSSILSAADTSISQNAAEISAQTATINQSAAEIANQSAAVNQNAAEIANQSLAVNQNAAEVVNQTAAVQNSVPSIWNMAATADSSTSSISNLASESASAAGAISGLGSAAQSAVASMNAAAANVASAAASAAASSASSPQPANNYNGGIYTGGKFLSWINEKGAEAIIPLNGSARAVSLWQQVGEMLGIYPAENADGGIYSRAGNFNGFKISTGTSWNPNLPNPLPQIEIPFENGGNIFGGIGKIFSGKFDNVVGDIFSTISDRISGGVGELVGGLSGIFGGHGFNNRGNFPNLFKLENILEPFKNIFGQITQPFENIFGSIKDIFGGGKFPLLTTPPTFPTQDNGTGIFGSLKDIFSGGKFPLLTTPPTFPTQDNGGIFGSIKDIFSGGKFPLLTTPPTFPTQDNGTGIFGSINNFNDGEFPTLENSSSNISSSQNLGSQSAPTVNITIYVQGSLDKEVVPEIKESFTSQIEKYFSEYQRRAFS